MKLNINKGKNNMYDSTATTNPISTVCEHKCDYCLVEGTQILMADFTMKPIEKIKKGDEVIGLLDEKGGYRKFKQTIVKGTMNRVAKTIIIETVGGSIECTPEHRIVGGTEARFSHGDWKMAKSFSPYESLKNIGLPKIKNKDFYRGWICGYVEGDGCFFEYKKGKRTYSRFDAVSIDAEITDALIEYARLFDVEIRRGIKNITSKKSFTCGNKYPMATITKHGEAEKLKKVSKFKRRQKIEFYEGYIGGIIDSDGSITDYIRISQIKSKAILEHINYSLDKAGFKYVVEDLGTRLRISRGISTRLKLLHNCTPVCIRKKNNLLLGRTTKNSPNYEITSMRTGRETRVYNIETESENYIANGFVVHNCSTHTFTNRYENLSEKYSGEPRLVRSVLTGNTGEGHIIFLCNMVDMFANDIPDEFILEILEECNKYPDNDYLFQSKNPKRFLDYLDKFPERSIFCTTIETNREEIIKDLSEAPSIASRVQAMCELRMLIWKEYQYMDWKLSITIEPVLDFDLMELEDIMKEISPDFVSIGADSKVCKFPKIYNDLKLPEPDADKLILFLRRLKKITEIREKSNLERLLEGIDVN